MRMVMVPMGIRGSASGGAAPKARQAASLPGATGGRPVRPSSAAATAALTAALPLEARGANPRLAYDRPLEAPKAIPRPLGVGEMRSRPLSANSYSLNRPAPRESREGPTYQQLPPSPPRGASSALEGSDAKSASRRLGGHSEFAPPDRVIAPTKPRVLGGRFSQASRDGPAAKDGNDSGGKTITNFPWGANRASQVFGGHSKGSATARAKTATQKYPPAPREQSSGLLMQVANANAGATFVIDQTATTTRMVP